MIVKIWFQNGDYDVFSFPSFEAFYNLEKQVQIEKFEIIANEHIEAK